jgi:hypothetical protein
MCTYSIAIDDQLVSQARSSLPDGVSFHLWLQQQVIELLKMQANNQHGRTRTHNRGLTDDQLAQQLAQYPSLSESDFPEVNAEDYAHFMRKSSGRIPKGIEKWL